jgi:16S rRNA C967 or C1407 C5-methylase (RsmB/RsmF family)
LEELIEGSQLYGNFPEFKDEQSLVCTVLFDYMTRKFQLRDKLIDEPIDNQDELTTRIEITIHNEKTDLAAELAKNRIKEDALTIDELLPKELREVDYHKAELPIYCWINLLKIDPSQLIEQLIDEDHLTMVENKSELDKKCFCLDAHCPNVLMFHYTLRDRITNHDLIKTSKLIIQDKSSCLGPNTVNKLLSKKDDVIVTNISGGLVSAFIGCMMEDYGGKVYVCGVNSDDKYQEITARLQKIGCSKYVKLLRENFTDLKYDDPRIENVKVILVNAPCSKSGLMNPMEFLFEEGEGICSFLINYCFF